MILPVDFLILVPVHVPLNLSQMEQLCSTSFVLGESGTIVVSGCSIPQSSWKNLEKERNDKQAWETSKPFTKIKLPPPKTMFTLSQSTTLPLCSFEKKLTPTSTSFALSFVVPSLDIGTYQGHIHSSYEHRGLRICYSNPGQKHMCLHACHLSSKKGAITYVWLDLFSNKHSYANPAAVPAFPGADMGDVNEVLLKSAFWTLLDWWPPRKPSA